MTHDHKPVGGDASEDQAIRIQRAASTLRVGWAVMLGAAAVLAAWRSDDPPGELSVGLASLAVFSIGGARPVLGGVLVVACGLLEWWAWSGTHGGTPVPAPLVTLLLPLMFLIALELWRPTRLDLDVVDRMDSQSRQLPRMLVLATPVMLVWLIALGRSL